MKKILMVLLLAVLFQSCATVSAYEEEVQTFTFEGETVVLDEEYWEKAINSLEENTSLSREEIEGLFFIYDNYGETDTLIAYQIIKECRFNDLEKRIYYNNCSYFNHKMVSLYILETLRKKEYLYTPEEGNWWE